MHESELTRFRGVWRALAGQGFCDAIDGREYRRVVSEWAQNGCPLPVARFIRSRANLMAPPAEEGIDLGKPPF